jgi:general bacterial porin, GBP family
VAASSQNGQLFARQANVGLSSKEMGTVTFGRHNVLGADVYGSYAPVQNANQFSPTGYSGTLGGSLGETEDARYDNSVKYTNKTGNFNYGAIYAFGNQAGSTGAASNYQVNFGYEANGFGIQAVYGVNHDVVKGDRNDASTVKATFFDTTGYAVLAKYKFNDTLTGKIGYERFSLQAPSNPTVDSALTYYPDTTYAIGSRYAITATQQQSVSHFGIDYFFSDKLQLNAGYFVRTYDNCSTGAAISGFNSDSGGKCGLTANFVGLLLDYNLSKRSDVYLGGMTSNYGGTNNGGSTYQNNSIIGLGIRHKF